MIESQPLIAYQPIRFNDKMPGDIDTIPLISLIFLLPFLSYRSFQTRNKYGIIEKAIQTIAGKKIKNHRHYPFLSLSNLVEFRPHKSLVNPFEIFPDANLLLNLYRGNQDNYNGRKLSNLDFDINDFTYCDFDGFKRNFFITYGFDSQLPQKEIKQIQIASSNNILPIETLLGYHQLEWINDPSKVKIDKGSNNVISRYTECILPDTRQSHFLNVRNITEGEILPESTILTGSCLGSIDFANAITESGKKISLTKRSDTIDEKVVELQFNEALSVYEISNIIESSSIISSILNSNNNFNKVAVNLPSGNYFLYILEAFESGFLSIAQAFEYFDKVEIKETKLLHSLTKRISKQTKRIIDIELVSNFGQDIKNRIRNYVATPNLVKNGLVDELIACFDSPILKKLLDSKGTISYSDISYFDYMSLYLEQDTPTVLVENYYEHSLLSKTKQAAKKIKVQKLNIHSAIYFMPRIVANLVFLDENSFKNRLYTAEGNLTLSTFKEIIKFYRQTFDFSVSELEYHQIFFDQIYDRNNAKKDGIILHRQILGKH
jgi:hypothetical protein